MMPKGKLDIRYQAAIVQDDHVLLLKVWDHAFSGETFWVIPGGGRLPGEAEEDCVKREAHEETHLQVEIDRLLLDEVAAAEDMYHYTKTYLCRINGGEPRPGTEPEVDTAEKSTITAVGWFDLRDATTWDPLLPKNPITYSLVQRVRAALGYVTDSPA